MTEALERPAAWRRRHGRLRLAFFITVALLLLVGMLAARADERRRRTPGTWQRSGSLTHNDRTCGPGRPVDIWLVKLDKGQPFRVEVRSRDFEPHAYAVGPLSADDPPVVAKGIESGNSKSRVAFAAGASGEYGIGIVSIGQAAYGAYELSSNHRVRTVWETSNEFDGVEDVLLALFAGLFVLQLSGLSVRAFWRSPDRILLLRPFGQGPVSRSLKRFARRNLAYRGFIFTLADEHLQHSLAAFALSHVPLDLGSIFFVFYRPLFRRAHRFVFVRKPSDLNLVRSRLRSRWRLGQFWQSWLGLGDRINKLRSRDELWKDCIDVLLDNCQVIVVDLSHIGAGTTWELEQLYRRGHHYKALFLVPDDDDQAAVAGELVSGIAVQCGAAAVAAPILYRYSPSVGSVLDAEAFENAYAEAVSSAQQPAAAALPISMKAVLAAAPIAVLGPLWLPVGVVLGFLALRDIRRADGMLRGEVLAHMTIFIGGAGLCLAAVVGGLWLVAK